ncbi:MAG: hypothetical protein AUJ07_00855 [Crenarchaeota archaeon 13_1_40CM_3_53_5]|nr:MAG: hypothetical protein AUJ07_00855 [Crenarchaeota archaeon 13_1_40CM_3_53_5]
MLTIKDGTLLVATARAAIESHLNGEKITPTPKAATNLTRPKGVFVTLLDYRGNQLRGCIGNPFPERPLLDQVSLMAVEAATSDPRFPPVKPVELKSNITVEVSVLTIPREVRVDKPILYRDEIVVGRDGLIVEGVGGRGLLLPQVAVEEGFDSEEFLSQCCLKAGLLPDAWLSGEIRVLKFHGQAFSEEKPEGRVFERKLAGKAER